MNSITRQTMRADGQTVGQAMDKDAAFLRSLGIPAPDGQLTLDERREAFKELTRDAVLVALDSMAEQISGLQKKGWTDADLVELFKVLDSHSRAVFNRITKS